MRGLKVYSTILATALLAFFGVIYWPAMKNLNNDLPNQVALSELQDLQMAENDYKKAKYENALKIILKHIDSIESNSEIGKEWLHLLVNISEKTYDVEQLVLINEQYPEALRKNEKASLLVAEMYLINEQDKEYNQLRNKWVGNENYEDAWKILDADYLLTIGLYDEGYQFLQNHNFQGKEEVAKLIRLSLINATDHPQKALDFLSEANKLDPSDPDVYIYTFKLLEKEGKYDLAMDTYKKAVSNNPKSIFLNDQLALAYVRKQQYKEAITTWEKCLDIVQQENNSNYERIIADIIFFNHVISGKKNNLNQYVNLSHDSKPFLNYLINLNQDRFVDQNAFSKIPLSEEYLAKTEVTYWLLLLDALKQNNQEKALTLMETSPFRGNSMNPALEFALWQTLNFQKNGFLQDPIAIHQTNGHPLLESINQPGDYPADIKTLLQSEEAFSAILLAAGWTESALNLHQIEVFPNDFPNYVSLDFAKALRKMRGDQAALNFAAKQEQTLDLNVLVQEMSAKKAFEEGNNSLAENIYVTISDKSFEAKSYLARKAFKENKYELALELTNDLLGKYPNNPLLMENLRKINKNIN